MNPTDYLKDVPEDNYFRLADGRIIKNLEELFSIVKDSGDTLFFDHVTPDRNDFASWIKECVKHQELYTKLMPLKDRQSFLNVLNQEITVLKNPKVSETMKFFSEDYDPKKENQESSTQTTQTATQATIQATTQATIQAPISGKTSPEIATSSNSELDFEQVLAPIIQEIQEEIFFWQ